MRATLWLTIFLTVFSLAACEDGGGADSEESDAATWPEGTPLWSEIHYEFAKGCTTIGCHSASLMQAQAAMAEHAAS